MIEHHIDIDNRIITGPTFSQNYPSSIKMGTKILTYFDGVKTKAIPLNLLISQPFVYDHYINNDGTQRDITITFCPFSFTTSVFAGKLELSKFVNKHVLVAQYENKLMSLVDGKLFDDPQKPIQRWECEIKLFKDALMTHPDFLLCTNVKKNKNMVDIDFYQNTEPLFPDIITQTVENIHPKTLIYLISYRRELKNGESVPIYKNSILIGKNANHHKPTGFSMTHNGFQNYLEEMEKKVRERSGFIIPMFLCVAQSYYPKHKIVKLY